MVGQQHNILEHFRIQTGLSVHSDKDDDDGGGCLCLHHAAHATHASHTAHASHAAHARTRLSLLRNLTDDRLKYYMG